MSSLRQLDFMFATDGIISYSRGQRICVLPDAFEAYLNSMFWSLQTIAAVG